MTPASSSVRADSRSGGGGAGVGGVVGGGGVAEAAPKGSSTLALKQRIGPGSYGVSALISLYSPKLVEEVFYELRLVRVLGSLPSPGPMSHASPGPVSLYACTSRP